MEAIGVAHDCSSSKYGDRASQKKKESVEREFFHRLFIYLVCRLNFLLIAKFPLQPIFIFAKVLPQSFILLLVDETLLFVLKEFSL
jgi:hypothetical protein